MFLSISLRDNIHRIVQRQEPHFWAPVDPLAPPFGGDPEGGGAPGQARVCRARQGPGLWWVNPLTPRRTLVSPFTEISILFKKGSSKKFPKEFGP